MDKDSHLATVRIPCFNLPVMKLGLSSNLQLGDFVIAMGSSLSLKNTISTGVVSNVERTLEDIQALLKMTGAGENLNPVNGLQKIIPHFGIFGPSGVMLYVQKNQLSSCHLQLCLNSFQNLLSIFLSN